MLRPNLSCNGMSCRAKSTLVPLNIDAYRVTRTQAANLPFSVNMGYLVSLIPKNLVWGLSGLYGEDLSQHFCRAFQDFFLN